jgi:hypothetical protein
MEPNQPPDNNNADFEPREDVVSLGKDEFKAAFGESLETTLDIDTWQPGDDLAAATERLEREIADSVGQDDRVRQEIRDRLFPIAFASPAAPPNAGSYQVKPANLEQVQRGLLFNGAVEACDGTSLVHDSLALTIAQIGVSTVSYVGNAGTWMQRLYRRDLRVKGTNPIEEAIMLLERRSRRGSTDAPDVRDKLSEISRRGIMSFAERKILLEKCTAPWRMGHGNPTPFELLTGGGLVIDHDMPLLRKSLEVWEKLLIKHKKWVFVPSAPADRVLLTLGNALYPLEYALIDTAGRVMRDIIEGHLPKGIKAEARKFVDAVGSQIVVGVYRASRAAPPQMFYAHLEYAHQAALIAMADSALREHRGFPMLIDLADQICRATFGASEFEAVVQQAYVQAGTPFRYLGERETRK